MSRLDDRLTKEIERATLPADPAGVFERIDRRRARRASARRIRMGALTVIVVLGCVGGFLALNRAFRTSDRLGGGSSEGSIVFSTYPASALNGEPTESIFSLYAVAPDGSGLHRLSSESDAVSAPAWSPDGSTIAYAPFSSGPDDPAWGIWVMDADGSNARQLVHTAGPVSAIDWSPDGSRLWFLVQRQPQSGPVTVDLMSVEADGRGVRSLIEDRVVTGISASPDGDSLALSVQADVSGGGLFVWDEEGGLQRVLPDTVFVNSPAWSPDGSTIAFIGNDADHVEHVQRPQQLFVVRPDGSDLRRITEGKAQLSGPSWSPSGDRLVFGSNVSHYDQFGFLTAPVICRLVTVAADGTDRRTIFDGADIDVCVASTAWQPSGAVGTTEPSPTPTSDAQVDLGLGFPVCDVRSIQADFDGNGTMDTASVATKMSDVGGCPQADTASNILGIDLIGDGMIDAEYGPIGCELDCRPFMAIDLDGDGADELLVEQVGGTVLGLVPYIVVGFDDVAADGPGIGELVVAPPGDPENGLVPGGPLTFSIGGDEGFSASLECQGSGVDRVLVATTGEVDSIDQPTAWTIRRTTFRLTSQGFDVVDTQSFDQPVEDVITPGSQQETNLCGIPFPPNPVFETP